MLDTRKIGTVPNLLMVALDQVHGPHSVDGLISGLGINRRQFNEAFRRLQIRGWAALAGPDAVQITPAGIGARERGEFITGGPKGRVKVIPDTFRQRCWAAMKVRRTFTIGEIVADAIRDEDGLGQPRDNAARYIRRLCQAGYVREEPRRIRCGTPGSNGFKRFRLMRSTGMRAPIFSEQRALIHDPNTGEDVPCSPR